MSAVKRIIGEVSFTSRELDILACIVGGYISTKHISSILFVSPKTINIHIGNVLSKIQRHSRHDIVPFLSKSTEYEALKNWFHNHLLKEATFREALRKEGAAIATKQPSYCLVWDKESKEKIDRIQIYLNLLGARDIKLIQRIPSKKQVEQENWHTFWDKEKKLWHIFPPSENESDFQTLESSTIVEDLQPNFWIFFLALLPDVFNTQLQSKILHELNNSTSPSVHLAEPSKISHLSTKQWKNIGYLCAILLILASSYFICSLYHCDKTITNVNSITYEKDHTIFERPYLTKQMDVSLSKQKKGIKSIALVGAAGSGKTFLARHFAKQKSAAVVWEFNIENSDSIQQAWLELAEELAVQTHQEKWLKKIKKTENEEEKNKKVLQFVQTALKKQGKWILIYHNLERIDAKQKYFPADTEIWGDGLIIGTTRDSNIENASFIPSTLNVGELSHDEALLFFEKITKSKLGSSYKAIGDAQNLFKIIPHFPLDIAIAAHYICEMRLTCEKYVEYLNKQNPHLDEMQQGFMKEMGALLNFEWVS